MLRNAIKIAWRNLRNNRIYSVINIAGLAVGMAVALLVGLWIWDELSYNTYHRNYGSIVKVMDNQGRHGQKNTNDDLPVPLAAGLRTLYSDEFRCVSLVRETEAHIISCGDRKFTQDGNFMEEDGPELLTLDMVYGSRKGLSDPHSILLSQTLAGKLFGNTDPVGKTVMIDAEKTATVAGVYADLPNNSEFHASSFIGAFALYGASMTAWDNYNILIIAQLKPGVKVTQVSEKIKGLLSKNVKEKDASHALFLLPMSKWHLYSTFENHVPVTSERLQIVWSYGLIGAFVLLLACINFMNLSTARSEKRTREVGIRKVMGSLRRQLVWQFLGESFFMAVLAFVGALGIVALVLPWFNGVADKSIRLPVTHPVFWVGAVAFVVVTSLLAGSYPAFYLSAFRPVRVLKGQFRAGRFSSIPRRVLVVVQFTVAVALIVSTVVVYNQIQYAKDRPVGYAKSGLISMRVQLPDFEDKYNTLRTEWLNTGVVADVARANYAITDTRGWNGGFSWNGKPPVDGQAFNTISVDIDYGNTVGWELVEGRGFDKRLSTDSSAIVLNESAVKVAGLVNPVGQIVKWETEWRPAHYYKIIGVVRDMVKGSPFGTTDPSVIFLGGGNWVFVRLRPHVPVHSALSRVDGAFKAVIPTLPFDYRFVDQEYGQKFAEEERVGILAKLFAVLAIFISCLGLFGLASYVAEQRRREIGVRKVLGASVFSVWRLLSMEFVLLVLLSCLIAAPLAYSFLQHWLQKYAYRIEISWWFFGVSFAGTVGITLLTVSWQAVRAGRANPVDSLRAE
ncbi:MAG: ABC transporter permease [Bacteroidetes bacterium]|nr:ABC transporter permease [Bacteroidota bacterium]